MKRALVVLIPFAVVWPMAASAETDVAPAAEETAAPAEVAADAGAIEAAAGTQRDAAAIQAAAGDVAGAAGGTPLAPTEKPALFVMDPKLVNLPSSVGGTVSGAIAKAAEEEGLSVMTRADAVQILSNAAELNALGADAAGIALAELGNAVGATNVIAASISYIDEDTIVQMRLIDTSRARVLSRRELRTSDYDGELIRTVRAATRLTLQPIFGHLKGRVRIDVTEEGANVLLDGNLIGVAPIAPFDVSGGYHMIAVTKNGFIRHQETVQIKGSDLIERTVRLRPSMEYINDYKGLHGPLRIFAWISSAIAVPAIGATVAMTVLKFSQDDTTLALAAEYEALSTAEQVAQVDSFNQRTQSSVNSANLYGSLLVTFAVTAAVTTVGSIAMWVFGEDPDRYAEFEVGAN